MNTINETRSSYDKVKVQVDLVAEFPKQFEIEMVDGNNSEVIRMKESQFNMIPPQVLFEM